MPSIMMTSSPKFQLVVSLLASLLVGKVGALPTGAPQAACGTLSPNPIEHGALPSTSPLPYSIDLSAFDVGGGVLQYTPGNSYQSVYHKTKFEWTTPQKNTCTCKIF